MPRSKQDQLADAATRREIARLYLEGWDMSQIGAHLGMSKQGVSYHICALREDWRASAEGDSASRFSEDLAKLTKLEQELWQAWAQSKRPKERTLTEHVEGEVGRRKASIGRETQSGDAHYLALILQVLRRRADMLGYDAPKRFRLDLDALDDAALKRISEGDFRDLVDA